MDGGYYRSKQVIAFLAPALFFFLVFNTYPLIQAFRMSFYNWNIVRPENSQFVGLANYMKAFGDPIFWTSMKNTVLYALVTVPAQMALGLLVAMFLNFNLPGTKAFRTIYYLPVISSWVVVSLLFRYLFNGEAGLVNYILVDLLHIFPSYISWFRNASTALFVIMLLGIWKGVGWSMVIFLAGLQGIPAELREASMIDGASSGQHFWRVILPILRPTMGFVAIMLVIGGFNVFTSVFLVTGGGPLHRTEVLLTYMYYQGFSRLNFGYGAALSYILGIIIFVISVIQLRLFQKPVEM
jgi:multiple sugar transport system permease protein